MAQSAWTLERCIAYALENSYTVKQKLVEKEQRRIQYQSSRMNALPAVSLSAGQNFDFGRAAAANAVIVDNTQATTSFGIGMNIPLFQGLQNYYTIASNRLDMQASVYDLEQARENTELNVTAYFLQVLLSQEIHLIAEQQVELSRSQLVRIEELVQSGRYPQSELYTIQANIASDELHAVEALNNYRLALLDLAQLMNIADIQNFDIVPSEAIDMDALIGRTVDLQSLVLHALDNRPAMKVAALQLQKGEKDIKVMQSQWYPTLSLSASYGTGYYHAFQQNITNLPFDMQLKNNSREMISLSLNIPLFDRLSAYHNVKLSKVNLLYRQLDMEEAKRKIEKEIYLAHTSAVASQNKYEAALKSVSAAQLAFQYEEMKYKEGKSTGFSFNEAKINYQKAQSEEVQAKYQYVLRMKILDFYGK
jgi:outer membrane protein